MADESGLGTVGSGLCVRRYPRFVFGGTTISFGGAMAACGTTRGRSTTNLSSCLLCFRGAGAATSDRMARARSSLSISESISRKIAAIFIRPEYTMRACTCRWDAHEGISPDQSGNVSLMCPYLEDGPSVFTAYTGIRKGTRMLSVASSRGTAYGGPIEALHCDQHARVAGEVATQLSMGEMMTRDTTRALRERKALSAHIIRLRGNESADEIAEEIIGVLEGNAVLGFAFRRSDNSLIVNGVRETRDAARLAGGEGDPEPVLVVPLLIGPPRLPPK
jgi:hypothetical protein